MPGKIDLDNPNRCALFDAILDARITNEERRLTKMTNGEKIRQMTDEELAEELTSLIINAIHSRAIFYGKVTEEQITAANLKWLKQEVSESALPGSAI